MSERKLKWGIIGTGMIARTLAKAISEARNAELVAVGSRTQARAEEFAAQFGGTAYAKYGALLADDEVEIVYNSLPNALHCEWTVRAAQASKHVLCEKPLAVTVEECEEMFAAAAVSGVKLMEAFMYRCHPQTDWLRQAVVDGRVGELRTIHSVFSYGLKDPSNIRLSAPLRGGGLMDVGCYCVNFSRHIASGEPVEVYGAAVAGAESGVDENFAATLVFPDGVLAQFDVGVRHAARSHAEIVGSEGRIEVPVPWKPGKEALVLVHRAGETMEEKIRGGNPYVLQVEHFSECVAENKPPLLTREDSLGNVAAIVALQQSAREKKAVVL